MYCSTRRGACNCRPVKVNKSIESDARGSFSSRAARAARKMAAGYGHVHHDAGQDQVSLGAPGPDLQLDRVRRPSAMTDTAWTFHTSIVVDHYHQRRPVPYRRYASTLTYGRALMGRASRENISCRGLRWDIFPLRSDYGSTSMAWVGLLKWAIYIWHSLLQV